MTGNRQLSRVEAKQVVTLLLPWFATNKRDLPWRREPYRSNPYCLYVAEVMISEIQIA
jgi:adenine-specific DNA glycosylase